MQYRPDYFDRFARLQFLDYVYLVGYADDELVPLTSAEKHASFAKLAADYS